MGRLIDSDLLLYDIEKSMNDNPHAENKVAINHRNEHLHFMNLLSKQPSAFDFDEVIKQLCDKIQENVDGETGEPCWNWVVDMQNKLICECIDIVKGGLK